MLTAFECGAGVVPFSAWVQQSESFSAKKSEKLELFMRPAYELLEDVLVTRFGKPLVRNQDAAGRVAAIAERTTFRWVEEAARALDELVVMVRRNIQKTAALDAMIIKLRNQL